MKTPEELFAALGNRGEYAALPPVTLDDVKAIYAEGQTCRLTKHSGDCAIYSLSQICDCGYLRDAIYMAGPLDTLLAQSWADHCRRLDEPALLRTVVSKLRTAINEAIANSGGHSPEEWENAQVELCRVLEEVKVMLGEKGESA